MIWTLLLACAQAPDAPEAPSSSHDPAADKGHEEHAAQGEHGHEGHGAHGHEGHGEGQQPTVHHRFDDAEKWAAVFDDPERDAWQQPDQVIGWMALSPGMVVADIGAGTGYFNPHLSRAVGPEGQVLALDVEDSLVAHMTERAAQEGTPNVVARKIPFDSAGLAPDSVDRVLLVDTYHHIGDRTDYFRDLATGVRDGGRLIIVDYKKEETPHGPKVGHRMAAETITGELAGAGWSLVSQHELPEQYVLVFEEEGPGSGE